MSRVEVHEDRVVIRLTAQEKILAWRRRDVVIDRSRITSVIITEDPWIWLRGVRAPGTQIPGKLAYGVWRNLAGSDFALLRKGVSAVVIDLDVPEGEDHDAARAAEFDAFARVILSTARAVELIEVLRLEQDAEEVFSTDTAN